MMTHLNSPPPPPRNVAELAVSYEVAEDEILGYTISDLEEVLRNEYTGINSIPEESIRNIIAQVMESRMSSTHAANDTAWRNENRWGLHPSNWFADPDTQQRDGDAMTPNQGMTGGGKRKCKKRESTKRKSKRKSKRKYKRKSKKKKRGRRKSRKRLTQKRRSPLRGGSALGGIKVMA